MNTKLIFKFLFFFLLVNSCDTPKSVSPIDTKKYAIPKYRAIDCDEHFLKNRFENCDSALVFSKQLILPITVAEQFENSNYSKEVYAEVIIPGFNLKLSKNIEHSFLIEPDCFVGMSSLDLYLFFTKSQNAANNYLQQEKKLALKGQGLNFGVIFSNLNFIFNAYVENGHVKRASVTQNSISH